MTRLHRRNKSRWHNVMKRAGWQWHEQRFWLLCGDELVMTWLSRGARPPGPGAQLRPCRIDGGLRREDEGAPESGVVGRSGRTADKNTVGYNLLLLTASGGAPLWDRPRSEVKPTPYYYRETVDGHTIEVGFEHYWQLADYIHGITPETAKCFPSRHYPTPVNQGAKAPESTTEEKSA